MTREDQFATLKQGDFLAHDVNSLGGLFDCIIMNPPFKQGRDIKHIRHAITLLKSSGRLVALCANGPRQRRELEPLATIWTELPAGTFEGTCVNAVMMTANA